jgi:hypothetical protein
LFRFLAFAAANGRNFRRCRRVSVETLTDAQLMTTLEMFVRADTAAAAETE